MSRVSLSGHLCSELAQSVAEAAKEDSVAQGAAALLRAQSLFRAVSRQPSAMAGLVAALMAGSRYNSPKAQQSILECYLLFALRFIRPPQLALAQVSLTPPLPRICWCCTPHLHSLICGSCILLSRVAFLWNSAYIVMLSTTRCCR